MSWVRLDDGAPEHRKVLALPRADRWTWIELLAYCSRQDEGGYVPDGVGDILRYVTPGFLAKCREVGLIDVDDAGDSRIHDWPEYRQKDATAAERMRRHRARNSDVTSDVTDRNATRNESVTRARAAARGPSRPVTNSPRTSSVGPARDDATSDDDELVLRLDQLNPSESQRLRWLLAASADRDLVRRQLAAAVANGRNPAAYFDTLVQAGEDPGDADAPPPAYERPPIDPDREAAAVAELEQLGELVPAEQALREIAGRAPRKDPDGD